MALSQRPLSYCTNVHPGVTLDQVLSGLEEYTGPVARRVGEPIAAGLWLARSVVDEALHADRLDELRRALERLGLVCYTLNAFPYGDFHSPRVKENVYRPDWTTAERIQYTLDCARVLAALLPDTLAVGSISTVPLGFKQAVDPAHAESFATACCEKLLETAAELARLKESTGKTIRLAIEPEPLCMLETTPETLAFFERLREAASRRGLTDVAREHLGVCYDVCHQAVEFESITDSLHALAEADVPVNKVHITCAIEADPHDAAAREALRAFVEPRYLHQTFAKGEDGICSETDLTERLIDDPPAAMASASVWRVHFHVPIHEESLGPLRTTRRELAEALAAVAALPQTPHLEVETYTWNVLPGARRLNLVEGITAELQAARALIRAAEASSATLPENA